MKGNNNLILNKAKKVKNDEFYTKYETVKNEISNYSPLIFENKIIFCNANDSLDSAFVKYFSENFDNLGLKEIISIFRKNNESYIFIKNKEGAFVRKTENVYDYSFNSELSLKILKTADIVITNPPYSLLKGYMKVVISSRKDFILLLPFHYLKNKDFINLYLYNYINLGYVFEHSFYTPTGQLAGAPCFFATSFKTNRLMNKKLKFMDIDKIPKDNYYIDDKNIFAFNKNTFPLNFWNPFTVSLWTIWGGILELGYDLLGYYDPVINGRRKFTRLLIQKTSLIKRR